MLKVWVLFSLLPFIQGSSVLSVGPRLSLVLADLQAEGVDISTATVVTSNSVTQREREELCGILGMTDVCVGFSNGIALSTTDLAHNVVYYPSAVDLTRQEGLMDALSPALSVAKGSVIVVCPNGWSPSQVQNVLKLEADYVSLAEAPTSLSKLQPGELVANKPAVPEVADWSTARRWYHIIQKAKREAIEQVQESEEFAQAHLAATAVAMEKIRGAPGALALSLQQSLESAWLQMAVPVLQQLEDEAFAGYKSRLSKLVISPNLPQDMRKVAHQAVKDFSSKCKKIPGGDAAAIHFGRRLSSHVQNRLLSAQASGQYRPLPRKGVTVGLHWLLPKPFGNDFRQEPWNIHASDNMVYVPKDKISDGWQEDVVPSPIGNDLLYTQ